METRKVLITGATGFLGRNLIETLMKKNEPFKIYTANSKTPEDMLEMCLKDCDFVFNFAAVHRPTDKAEFNQINNQYFENILDILEKYNNRCPVIYTSSIQANDNSEYGVSKVNGENALKGHAEKMLSRGWIYRLTNTFGKWARPNGHSVIATFCYNINHALPIKINDPSHVMNLYYIDDVITDFVQRLYEFENSETGIEYRLLDKDCMYSITLQEIADKLYMFCDCLKNGKAIDLQSEFDKKLFRTFISYQ